MKLLLLTSIEYDFHDNTEIYKPIVINFDNVCNFVTRNHTVINFVDHNSVTVVESVDEILDDLRRAYG